MYELLLKELSDSYTDDFILLCCDGAAWHKSATLEIPEKMETVLYFSLYPRNESNWADMERAAEIGFRNEIFATLGKVVDMLCDSINSPSKKNDYEYYW